MKQRIYKVASLDFLEESKAIQPFWYRIPLCGESKLFRLWLYCQNPGSHELLFSATSSNRSEILANALRIHFELEPLKLPLASYNYENLVNTYNQTRHKYWVDFESKQGQIIKGVIQKEFAASASASSNLSPVSPPSGKGNEKESLMLDIYLETLL